MSSRILLWLFVLLVGACASSVTTVTHDLEYQAPAKYSGKQPIHGPVVLLITSEFKQATLERFAYGDIRRFSAGPALVQEAEHLGRALFPNLTVIHADTIPPNVSAHVILVPKATINMQMAMMGWSSTVTTVSLEWSLKDRSGETLWVSTVDGKREGAIGSRFSATKNMGRLLNGALRAAFVQSYDRIGADIDFRNIIQSKTRQ